MRVGFGYDVHRLVQGRKLILGGVEISYDKGLEGHSDADVLMHAVMDALLGAAGMGDIGMHFPDSDPAYRGISSMLLLEKVAGKLASRGYVVHNVDCTVVAQAPRMSPHIGRMRENIAGILGLDISRANVKATTTEGLGFTGMGEGIAAYAVVLIGTVPGCL
ncbi:MAG: 2-C-methyl-D-erythritol 2,4-cyclodiphosphate synthase [Bacillota bacterium]